LKKFIQNQSSFNKAILVLIGIYQLTRRRKAPRLFFKNS
jgi:hypothetical protein